MSRFRVDHIDFGVPMVMCRSCGGRHPLGAMLTQGSVRVVWSDLDWQAHTEWTCQRCADRKAWDRQDVMHPIVPSKSPPVPG